jgi:hypothetical protein
MNVFGDSIIIWITSIRRYDAGKFLQTIPAAKEPPMV